jgi:lambda family phage tail tape measure protein
MAVNMDALLRIKADVVGQNNIVRLGGSLQGLKKQAEGVSSGFSGLKGSVEKFGAAIAGSAIVGGLTAVVKRAIDAGDELFNLQAKTGIAASALIGIGNAAKLADVEVETLGKSLTKLSVNLVKAAEGNEGLAAKFAALGVQVKDANGNVVPADQALKQIADRFADMPDGAQKAAAAVALFGKSGSDLIPLLNEGAASMEKFTYKVGDDFAARSDIFNDTLTEFGIKTQGFGMELTDALLPALQSILDVFGELFDTKQDWTALFEVITFGLRSVATVIYATIKLVDVAIKNVVAYLQAIREAIQGNFAGAADIAQNRIGGLLEQARRDFGQIQRLWTDAPSPGSGRRTGGRGMALDTSEADKRADAEARKAAAEAKRRANEQERLEERRASLRQKAISLEKQLRNSIEDVTAAYQGVGVSAVDELLLQRDEAIRQSNRQVDELVTNVAELVREVNAAGGSIDVAPYRNLINQLADANVALAQKEYEQGMKEIGERASEAAIDQLKFVDAVESQTGALAGARSGISTYLEDIGTLSENISSVTQSAFKGLEDAIVSLTTTGKFSFKDFAMSIVDDLTRMVTRMLIIAPALQFIQSLIPGGGLNLSGSKALSTGKITPGGIFAMGGIMTGDGPVPLRKYAAGGIATSPQLALFGEGSRPEAYVPLPDGRRIPVAMQGGGGVAVGEINIAVQNTGDNLSPEAQKRIASQVQGIVLTTLVNQKRSGGIL